MCYSTMYSPEPEEPKVTSHWRRVPIHHRRNGVSLSRKTHYIRTGSTKTLCGKHDEAEFKPEKRYHNRNTAYFNEHPEEVCSACLKTAKSMLFNHEITTIY